MSDIHDRIKENLPLKDKIPFLTGLRMAGPHLESCPFCDGHECFSIEEKFFKCFQCDAKGDVFTFLEKYERLTQKEAFERAAALAGIDIAPKKTKPVDGPPSVRDKIFAAAVDYCRAHALENGGKEYFLETRKRAERVIAAEKVGWSDGRLHEHLLGLGFSIIDCVESGLVKIDGDKNKDAFYPGCALFPQFSQGRVLHISKKDPKSKTCPDSEKAWRKAQLRKEYRDKDWIAYGQDALYRKGELVIVEGEHDRLSLLEAGLDNVIATIGNPSAERFKQIVSHCSGRHVYLCFDNDIGGKGGKLDNGTWHEGYTRRFAHALMAAGAIVRIMVFDGAKDIDEYFGAHTGDRHREVKRLQEESVDLVSWDIGQAAGLGSLEAKLKHLKDNGVFKASAGMSDLERDIFLEKVTGLGFSRKAVEETIEKEDDLLSRLYVYMSGVEKKNWDTHKMGDICYRWFSARGKFFRTSDHRAYLFYGRTLYQIGNNNEFNAMMERLTRFSAIMAPGKDVWYWLETFCVGRGDVVSILSWLHTRRESDTIFLNFNSPNNALIKLAPGSEPEEVPNGTNPDGVLLSSSPNIKPFRYVPGANPREALLALKTLFLDNLTCEVEDRYFVLCWLMTFVFLDFVTVKGILKFEGDSQSGKSTAADMCFALIYGDGAAGQNTFAGAMREGAKNPLLVLDNMESADFTKQFKNLLLMGRDSRGRNKSRGGTDSETIDETLRTLMLVTAIEPFSGGLSEIVTGTFTLLFKERLQRSGFIKDEVISGIVKKRDLILSGIFKLVALEVLPKLGERSRWLNVLETTYPKHNKKRANEFISLLLVILETLVKKDRIPLYPPGHLAHGEGTDASHILRKWISAQDELASEVSVSSNSILNMLNGFVRECEALMKDKNLVAEPRKGFDVDVHVFTHPIYLIEVLRTLGELKTVALDGEDIQTTVKYFQFDFKMQELFYALNRFCRENGTKNPYGDPMTLSRRMKNDRETIKKGGWEFIGREDGSMHNRTVRGDKIYRLRKELLFGV